MNERRQHHRFPADVTVVAKVGSSIPARVIDVSEGGIGLETAVSLRPTSVCDVSLSTNKGELQIRAKVRRCRANLAGAADGLGSRVVYHSGLEFMAIDEEQRHAIAVGFGSSG